MSVTKDSGTSKTAHVMNLIRKPGGTEEGKKEAPVESAAPAPAAAPAQQLPPVLASVKEDAAVAQQIKDALEETLEVEAPAAVAASAPAEVPTASEPAPTAAPAPAAVEVPSAVVEEAARQAENSRLGYVNVMQLLVEEKAEKYMQMFGVCRCDRCLADVKAMALNTLPPKYVVMQPGEFVPRITVYEGQFASAVTAQLLRACNIVQESPRH